MELRHERRKVNGVELHCVVAGSGPLVVLLHGFPEFWYSWRHQIPALAEHFTVVAPDMRGYNESEKPPRVADYAMPALVEDIVQLIGSFSQRSAIVVGHDWGGAVTWSLSLARPDIVEKLGILNVPHPRLFMQHLMTNPRQMLRSWYMLAVQVPWLPETIMRASNYRFIEQAFRGNAIHQEQFPDDAIDAYKRAAAQPGALTSALNYYRAAARGGTLDAVESDLVVQAPTLVIWGEQDFALGKELNNNLERYVPDLTMRFIADAGHWVQQDCPDLVNRYLLDFLLTNSRG